MKRFTKELNQQLNFRFDFLITIYNFYKILSFFTKFFCFTLLSFYYKNTKVVFGGHYDVDMVLEGPRQEILYQGIKKQYDTFTWTPAQSGIYTICFSNEFSTFSHKLVYFDFQVGEEPPLPGTGEHLTAMTQVSIRV